MGVELPAKEEVPILRVDTRSSTEKRRESRSKRRTGRKTRKSRRQEPDSGDSNHSDESIPEQPMATPGNGVEPRGVTEDISEQVREDLARVSPEVVRKDTLATDLPVSPRRVRFNDKPVFIEPEKTVNQYDILQDIKDQRANVTIGQLLDDNANYQKLIRETWTKRRKRRFKLPAVAVNFASVEDYGPPEVTVEVEGCTIPKVLVDGGSGVNLMLEDTAFDLGFTTFETTNQVLRMADQSRVLPVGRLSQVPTRIGELTYLLNFVIIRVDKGRPFPILLGRPWLYAARVIVDWGQKEFVIGKPSVRIPWSLEEHQGETSESDGYTTDWTETEDSDPSAVYLVQEFDGVTETDFDFPNPVIECGEPEENMKKEGPVEDRALGEASVPLTSGWIKEQIKGGELPTVGLTEGKSDLPWSTIRATAEEQEPDQIKNVVRPSDYEKVEVQEGKSFFLSKSLSATEKKKYVKLLSEYVDVFAWASSDLTGIPLHLGEHRIDLVEGAVPVRQRQYRLNPKYSLMVKEEIDSLLAAGFIYPVNNSEWVSPIVVVPKKVGADGKVKIRVCQDFRKLNAATKKDYFPLPFTDIILDHVSGQECYSFLDGFSGYNQVFIRMADQLKTTFTTEWGTYAFNRMPFGLCNAPGTFQRLMMDIFQDFLRHFLEVFIDDFAVFSTKEQHLEFLEKTFLRCRETGLKLHPGKCFLGMVSGILLGHVVSKKGLAVDSDKVKAILTFVPPTCVREVRGFLGCVGYYRRFIEGYAKLANPLTELLKKEVEFIWTEERQRSFEELKLRLVKAPILAPPDWKQEFHVTLDASGWCLGAILWQMEDKRERPIYYASRQMSSAERNYTATEREALAVVYACKKFRHYLLGYRIVFHTDHDSLKYLVNKPDLSGRLARWILLLQEFNYEVVVKPGKANTNADFLSRQRGPEAVEDISTGFPDEFFDEQQQTGGEQLQEVAVFHIGEIEGSDFENIIRYLKDHTFPENYSPEERVIFQQKAAPYTLIQGVLFKMGADDKLRRCLEKRERKQVMTALHFGSSGGHFAAVTTVNRIRMAGYWWPSMIRDTKTFVGSCDQCQRAGAPSFKNHWPLTPIIPLAPFEKWGVDFIGPINPVTARKKKYIILATDYATKWVEAKATRRNDALTAATFIFEEIMMRFGHPLELVSDQGMHFLNDMIRAITTTYLIKHRKTTPYNPKANGLTERANEIVGKVLNKMVSAHKTDWDRKLQSAVHAYNTSEKTTTGKSPFFLVFGQTALHKIEMEVETHRVMAARQAEREVNSEVRLLAIEDLEEARADALEQTILVQTKRKQDFNARLPRSHGVEEGGLVLLYDNRHEDFPGKLHTRWMGPYKVRTIFPNGSLQLEDLRGVSLETRVNGSRVKRYNPDSFSDSEPEDSPTAPT